VKLNRDNPNEKCGFTIVELLTVMSIIILLISLLVPALNRVRRYATRVKQSAQFHSIAVALDLFNAEYDGYPDSNGRDDQGQPYCGAMKLCEAMVGQDLKGFNPKSRFRREAFVRPNSFPPTLYPFQVDTPSVQEYSDNIKSRKMHLQLENANAYQLDEIYDFNNEDVQTPGYLNYTFVLCDVYNRVTNRTTGKKIGMPILYYRADLTKTSCPKLNDTAANIRSHFGEYIYEVRDDQGIIDMGMPWQPGYHPLASGVSGGMVYPKTFYDMIRDPKSIRDPMVPTGDRPYRTDSYILLSAGFDGQYGTSDDVFNFNKEGE
jgi:type II secretory pathway pseudopilin PulG